MSKRSRRRRRREVARRRGRPRGRGHGRGFYTWSGIDGLMFALGFVRTAGERNEPAGEWASWR